MDIRQAILTVFVAFAAASPAPAQAPDAPVRTALLEGRCDTLILAGQDASAGCRGAVVNARYRSGRFSFMFMQEGAMTSFSGINPTGEAGRRRLTIDRITQVSQADTTARPATGLCEFGDIDAGPAEIRCAGRTEAGAFVGVFATGGPPTRILE